jgi:hypothetical protein
MFYFDGDHAALAAGQATTGSDELQTIHAKLLDLHTALYPRMRNHGLDLHPRWQKTSIVSRESAAELDPVQSVVLTYFRSREQAEMVERLMGKDRITAGCQVDTYRHPVIELRLTPDHFVVELILSPYAWWDQRNFIGKLERPNQRQAFRRLLRDLDDDYRFGFWNGVHLSDMHLTNGELQFGRVLDEWMDTFADGQDWLRVGKWYTPYNAALSTDNILSEVLRAIKSLHSIYQFMLWTSNNNFHAFYEKRESQLLRYQA